MCACSVNIPWLSNNADVSASCVGTAGGRDSADVITSSLDGGSASAGGRSNADVTISSLDGGGRVGGRGSIDVITSSVCGGNVDVPVDTHGGWRGNTDVTTS